MTAPMTPPECDLRDFPFMPLDVVRLRDSDMAAHTDAEVFRAALLSWCVSWHQVPAASLPDDDAAIARLIGMGRDVKGFKKLRAAGALDGFALCSDGRLYHAVVAEKAVKSWEAKQSQRDRTEKARLARLSQNKEKSVTDKETHHEASVVSVTNQSKGEVRDSKGKGEKKEPELRSEPSPTIEIPVWIPAEPWAGFIEMRKKIRAPMTERGVLLTIGALKKLRSTEDIGAVLDQSTMNNWKGVFRVKHDQESYGNRQKSPTAHDKFIAAGLSIIEGLERERPHGEEPAGDDSLDGLGRPLLSA